MVIWTHWPCTRTCPRSIDLRWQVPVTAPYPILEFLGGGDERCIGEVHRPVRIGLHQLERAQ